MPGPMLHAVEIAANAPVIHRAIATREGEAAFWTTDCDVQPVVGTIARFGFKGAHVDLRMRVDELAPTLIRWTCLGDFPFWADTRVGWEIRGSETGVGSMVVFRQDGWPDDYPDLEWAKVNYTWGRIVGALKAYAETGAPAPFLG